MDDFKEDIQLGDEENQQKTNNAQPNTNEGQNQEQKIGEKVNLSEFNFSKAAHPTACFFHVVFKLLAIITYLLMGLF